MLSVFFCDLVTQTEVTLCLMFEMDERTSEGSGRNQLTSIFGLRELLHLQLKVGVIWEAIKMLGQDP